MIDITTEKLMQLASSTIQAGDVYRMQLTIKEGVKPKGENDVSRNKYFIVMGVSPDGSLIGFVLINSDVNKNIPVRARNSHYKIHVSDYPFLEQDRYVCCGELKEIETSIFFERFRNGMIGKINDNHLEAIRGMIAMSANVSTRILRDYNII